MGNYFLGRQYLDPGFFRGLNPGPVPYALSKTWFLYKMVAHINMRTHGVNQAFRFVEGIWLHRKSRQIRFSVGKDLFYFISAQHVLNYQLL